MTQLAFDLAPLVEPTYEKDATLAERFAAFHDANPHVADALEHLAAQWLTRHDHVGMKALFERLRWESGIRTEGDPYCLNNNWTAYYARLLIERRPEWASAFRLRELKSERNAA
ncbi:MAG: hypothetical protein J7518_22445 [Nocardioidaceae bacterium]|nr:hypothetical protein [Nocardioidaceae bacterium]